MKEYLNHEDRSYPFAELQTNPKVFILGNVVSICLYIHKRTNELCIAGNDLEGTPQVLIHETTKIGREHFRGAPNYVSRNKHLTISITEEGVRVTDQSTFGTTVEDMEQQEDSPTIPIALNS
jgi:hypothetical protein